MVIDNRVRARVRVATLSTVYDVTLVERYSDSDLAE